MKIKYYGHSCFMLTSESGVRVLTDPCDPETGYALHDIETDIVTISHDHHDHCYKKAVKGEPIFIENSGKHDVLGIKIWGYDTYHDDCMGKKRGSNILFKYEIDGMKIVHTGDIGSIAGIAEEVGTIDVLFVCVGGVYTIDAYDARVLANNLKPKVVIPMHYNTPALSFNLNEVADFVNSAHDCKIHKLNQSEATLTKENLGTDRILVLSC